MDEYNYEHLLKTIYGSELLTTTQLSKIFGRSVPSLKLDRKKGTGVPYSQDNKNSVVRYSIKNIIKYLHDTGY